MIAKWVKKKVFDAALKFFLGGRKGGELLVALKMKFIKNYQPAHY